MPMRPPVPCGYPGCQTLTHGGRCELHRAAGRRESDSRRGSSTDRGYGSRWQRARAAHLAAHPLCVECQKEGRVEPATEVDHVIPHRGDAVKFWDEGNWQGLCKSHHAAKTARGT
jgi:5-methylcytosine-specific restriction protein A